MMLLAVNIGNTHTSFGIFSKSVLLRFGKWRTHPIGAVGEEFQSLLSEVDSIAIASVVPQALENYRLPGVEILDQKAPFSFKIGTDFPMKTGLDRLLAAEAALGDFGPPVIVIDAGTATTWSVVDSDRVFLGGAITAGLGISMKTLTGQTAQLFSLDLGGASSGFIGRNTQEALLSGLLRGHAAQVDALVEGMSFELGGAKPSVVLTGGMSPFLLPYCKRIDHHDPHLVLRGIAYVHKSIQNRKSSNAFAR